MKKAINWYLDSILSNFKRYRKKIGGKWYKIRDYDVSGFSVPGEYWVRDLPGDDYYDIIEEENYRS